MIYLFFLASLGLNIITVWYIFNMLKLNVSIFENTKICVGEINVRNVFFPYPAYFFANPRQQRDAHPTANDRPIVRAHNGLPHYPMTNLALVRVVSTKAHWLLCRRAWILPVIQVSPPQDWPSVRPGERRTLLSGEVRRR